MMVVRVVVMVTVSALVALGMRRELWDHGFIEVRIIRQVHVVQIMLLIVFIVGRCMMMWDV